MIGELVIFVDAGAGPCQASSYTLRSVPYQLRGAMCHYGEVPEGGAYKALVTEALGGGALRWHVLDDVTVRCKSQEEMQEMLEAEGLGRSLGRWRWILEDGDGDRYFLEMILHFAAVERMKIFLSVTAIKPRKSRLLMGMDRVRVVIY